MPRNRFNTTARRALICGVSLWSLADAAFAQAPAPPPPVLSGSVGVGLALTSGNSDTSNVNLAIKATYDPANPHRITADAIYLRGTNEGALNINRSLLGVRDEYVLTARALLFGQVRYLRDTFKEIDYLLAPTGGIGYRVIASDPTNLSIDAGAGAVWERNTGLGTTSSGAISLGENLSHKLSSTATITQAINGLWKTSDVGDALYTLSLGLTATVTQKTTIKFELLETYKTLPPSPTVQKQDVALVTSLVYAF